MLLKRVLECIQVVTSWVHMFLSSSTIVATHYQFSILLDHRNIISFLSSSTIVATHYQFSILLYHRNIISFLSSSTIVATHNQFSILLYRKYDILKRYIYAAKKLFLSFKKMEKWNSLLTCSI